LFRVTFLAHSMLKWLLEFAKFVQPLLYTRCIEIWIIICVTFSAVRVACSGLFGSCGIATTRYRASSFTRFLDHTQRRTTIGGTPLDEWSARRRDIYQTHNTHYRQTSMPPGGWIRTHNLSRRAATDPRVSPRGNSHRLFWFILMTVYC
jgi:hypothetical protein